MNYLQLGRVKLLLFIILGIGFSTSFAQLPGSSDLSSENQRETTRLERFYEIQLKEALSNYYNEDSYLIDAKVALEEVMVPKEYRRSREKEEPLKLDKLPGLPILPEGFSRKVDDDTVKPDQYSSALKISQKTVRVVVDTSYSYDDISFVEELVRSEANLDAMRGDMVTVDQKAFPRSKNELAQQKQAETPPPAQEEPSTIQEEDSLAVAAEESGKEETAEAGFFSLDNPELLRYVIYGLLAFVLLLVTALFLSGRKSRDENGNHISRNGSDQQAFDDLKAEIQSLKEDEPSGKEEEDVSEITPERRALFEKDRSYITNQYISKPQKVADLLQGWMEEDDDGMLKAAKAVKGGNEKLLTTLRPVLKRENFDSLQYCLEDMDPMPQHEQMKQAREFRKALQEASPGQEQKEDADHDMFNFINQLSDDQILHLFKDESDDMIAIALAQLDGDRSANILQLLDEERRTSILVKMGNISDLSIDAYKEVANHFSEKALKIINMKYVAADGVQSILQLIDTLPVNQQEQYVQSIAESDLKLAKRVREYFVGFSDIPSIEDHVLEESLNELQTETVILALIGADQDIYNRVMNFRAKREKMLIKSEIENRTNPNKSEIDDARKKLLQKIRNKTKELNS